MIANKWSNFFQQFQKMCEQVIFVSFSLQVFIFIQDFFFAWKMVQIIWCKRTPIFQWGSSKNCTFILNRMVLERVLVLKSKVKLHKHATATTYDQPSSVYPTSHKCKHKQNMRSSEKKKTSGVYNFNRNYCCKLLGPCDRCVDCAEFTAAASVIYMYLFYFFQQFRVEGLQC